jgi:hypothetical protein
MSGLLQYEHWNNPPEAGHNTYSMNIGTNLLKQDIIPTA